MLKYCAFISLCAGIVLAQAPGPQWLSGQAARLVVGQTTFTQQADGTSDVLLGAVGAVAFAGNHLFVADSNTMGNVPSNNRVLVYNNVFQTFPSPTALLQQAQSTCPVCIGQASVVVGQPNFLTNDFNISQTGMRLPCAVASDGNILVVADTENNRILIWKSIPTQNGQPADIVLGQTNFTTVGSVVVNASSFRRPEGVWVQNGVLFVADTDNNRVLIWKSIPTQNNQPADVVVGQPNFTTVPELNLVNQNPNAAANIMLNPIGVSSDGVHLFVADLGYNRVLIFNSIPTQNGASADVEIGQADMIHTVPDDTTDLCASNGTDSNGNPTYPSICATTLSFPRAVISDGRRLYVADGGNDRILIYESIPTQNAVAADEVLGEPDMFSDVVTSNTSLFTPLLNTSSPDTVPSPLSLAWDGTNLYAADPTNRRVLIFTPEQPNVPVQGIVNAASRAIYAEANVLIGGTIRAADTITITINTANYTYTVLSTDTLDTITTALTNLINAGAGDPNALAIDEVGQETVLLVARIPGANGDNITLATTISTDGTETATASDSVFDGGASAAVIAPGTIVSIIGTNLADTTVTAPANTVLPTALGGVTVYFDGNAVPLLYVSPTQINAQMPWELLDRNGASAYVRTSHADGSVTVTNAIGIPIVNDSPGIFASGGSDPRVAVAYHGSIYAQGLVLVDGSIVAGDVATVFIEDRGYNYTIQATDTTSSVAQALVDAINSNPEEKMTAAVAGQYSFYFVLTAKVPGPAGNGIAYSATAVNSAGSITSASIVITATGSAICCANTGPITPDNPAAPGEFIILYGTGMGLIGPSSAEQLIQDGTPYDGPPADQSDANLGIPINTVVSAASALAGGVSANIVNAGLQPGTIGTYLITLQLGNTIPTNLFTQVTVSQDIYTSNIVTIPVVSPTPPSN